MPYNIEVMPSCEEAIRKKTQKNLSLMQALENKIQRILDNPYQFKPMHFPLQNLRRAHILGCFVLLYNIDETNKLVCLVRFAHHDEAYRF